MHIEKLKLEENCGTSADVLYVLIYSVIVNATMKSATIPLSISENINMKYSKWRIAHFARSSSRLHFVRVFKALPRSPRSVVTVHRTLPSATELCIRGWACSTAVSQVVNAQGSLQRRARVFDGVTRTAQCWLYTSNVRVHLFATRMIGPCRISFAGIDWDGSLQIEPTDPYKANPTRPDRSGCRQLLARPDPTRTEP